MKQFRFILLCATIAVISSSLTGCKKGVYDEQAALSAQKDLLQFKYDQEIKLENLRASNQIGFYNSYLPLQYNFSIRTALFYDSLNKANNNFWNDMNLANFRKRDISVKVKDLVSGAPVIGAEVTIPTSVGTVIKVKTDSFGIAKFTPNSNIPNPASAIATMEGYAAGSVFATIKGSSTEGAFAEISIWNLKNAPNTVKGKIYIENDLTNDEAEVAKKAFVNAFTIVEVNGYNQRFDFTTTTDDNGDYSMKIPNLTTSLQIAHTAIEGTSKMYVNGYVPGMDTVPTLKSIDATYFLGNSSVILNSKGSSYGTYYIEQPDNTIYSIPTDFDRYHVAAAADSNGRGHYVKNLSFSQSTLSSATSDSAYLTNAGFYTYTTSDLTSGASYSANNTTPSNRYTSKYLAGTKVRDTVTATLYDLLANADGYWKTAPTLKFVLNTDSTGNKFKYIEKLIQTKGGIVKKEDVNFTHEQTLSNLVKTISSENASTYNDRNINAGFTSIGTTQINNGKTFVYDMSFGCGKLKTAVR